MNACFFLAKAIQTSASLIFLRYEFDKYSYRQDAISYLEWGAKITVWNMNVLSHLNILTALVEEGEFIYQHLCHYFKS